jgi:hypothetical protein
MVASRLARHIGEAARRERPEPSRVAARRNRREVPLD